jgi:hypothetical protein
VFERSNTMKKATLLVGAVVAIAALALPGGAFAGKRDRDHDKMADKWERKHDLNTKKNDAKKDPDRDHLSNLNEFRAHTDPHEADSDDDGVRDGAEDRDRDGVRNAEEQREGTRCDDADTDDDGVRDGAEVIGTVASFTPGAESGTGTLVINLAGGGTRTGQVTSATRIKCEDEDENEVHRSSSGSGDNSGPGGGDDDRSGPGGGDDNDDRSGPGGGDDDERVCSTADLTPGTPVHEAELETQGGQAVFEEVELVK